MDVAILMSLNLPKERYVSAPAGLFKRLLAFLLDLIIVDIIILSPFKPLVERMLPQEGILSTARFLMEAPAIMNKLLVISGITGALMLLYFVILEYATGQTIGKMVLNLFVVSGKKRPSLWQAILRNAFIIPLFPFILFWIIEPAVMLFHPQRRRLLEILSNTNTIERIKVG